MQATTQKKNVTSALELALSNTAISVSQLILRPTFKYFTVFYELLGLRLLFLTKLTNTPLLLFIHFGIFAILGWKAEYFHAYFTF